MASGLAAALPAASLAQSEAQTQPAAGAAGASPSAPVAPSAPAAPAEAAHGPAAAAPASQSVPHAAGEAAPAVEAAPVVIPEGGDVPKSLLPHDLSPWGMFMAADLVVKAVMIGLAFASVVTWTVWFAKTLELLFARAKVARTLSVLRKSRTLAEADAALPDKKGAAPAVVHAALAEWDASEGLNAEGIKERVIVSLNRIEAAAGRRMTAGTGVLATIGSTAPFVGLFGTVWGIMNAFIGISKAQTTNLAVVAPGIAEALLATAIGLVAAIPAVVIYNVFARAIAGYRAGLADVSAEALRHLSRDLDREAAGEPATLRAAAE